MALYTRVSIRFTEVALADCGSYAKCAAFHNLAPRDVPFRHEDYEISILIQQFKNFGPFPPKYRELIEGNQEIDMIIQYLFEKVPRSEMTHFSLVSERRC